MLTPSSSILTHSSFPDVNSPSFSALILPILLGILHLWLTMGVFSQQSKKRVQCWAVNRGHRPHHKIYKPDQVFFFRPLSQTSHDTKRSRGLRTGIVPCSEMQPSQHIQQTKPSMSGLERYTSLYNLPLVLSKYYLFISQRKRAAIILHTNEVQPSALI